MHENVCHLIIIYSDVHGVHLKTLFPTNNVIATEPILIKRQANVAYGPTLNRYRHTVRFCCYVSTLQVTIVEHIFSQKQKLTDRVACNE